ncbi:hypothetical protein V7S43_017083 [Phytophthora oleae]|uniref:Uncharacterized protein n=1 Tax=Phytophthora oleae TaxID=2107226 RepID=A0ABD3ETP8_9STRA
MTILQASSTSTFRDRDSGQSTPSGTRPHTSQSLRHAVSVLPEVHRGDVRQLSMAVDTPPSVEEATNSERSRGTPEGKDFMCISCSIVLELPKGLGPSEIVCPLFLQLAAVKKPNQSVMPAFGTEKKRSSASLIRLVASLRKGPSMLGS